MNEENIVIVKNQDVEKKKKNLHVLKESLNELVMKEKIFDGLILYFVENVTIVKDLLQGINLKINKTKDIIEFQKILEEMLDKFEHLGSYCGSESISNSDQLRSKYAGKNEVDLFEIQINKIAMFLLNDKFLQKIVILQELVTLTQKFTSNIIANIKDECKPLEKIQSFLSGYLDFVKKIEKREGLKENSLVTEISQTSLTLFMGTINIAPVQRLTRYDMQMEEICKNLKEYYDEDNEYFKMFSKIHEYIMMQTKKINETVRVRENNRELIEKRRALTLLEIKLNGYQKELTSTSISEKGRKRLGINVQEVQTAIEKLKKEEEDLNKEWENSLAKKKECEISFKALEEEFKNFRKEVSEFLRNEFVPPPPQDMPPPLPEEINNDQPNVDNNKVQNEIIIEEIDLENNVVENQVNQNNDNANNLPENNAELVPPPPQDIPPPPPQFGNNGLLVEEEVPPPPVDLPLPLPNDNVVVNNNANALPIEAKDIKEKFFKDKFDALIGEIKIIFPENKKVESLIDEFYKVKLNRYFKESALKRNFKLSRIENINTVFKQVLLENGNDLSDEKKEELDKICRKLFTLTASLPPIAAAISHLKNILLAEQGRNKKRKEVADSITTDELEKLTIAFYSKPHVTEEDRRAYYYAMNDLFEAAREKLGHKYAFWKEAISTVYSPKAHLNEQYKELIKAEGEKLMECVKGNEGCVRAVSDAMEKLSNYYDIKGTDKPEKKIAELREQVGMLKVNLSQAGFVGEEIDKICAKLDNLVTLPVIASGIEGFQQIADNENKKGQFDKAKNAEAAMHSLTRQALNLYQNGDIGNHNDFKDNINAEIKNLNIRKFLFFGSFKEKVAVKASKAFSAAMALAAA